jgi:predicted ATPase
VPELSNEFQSLPDEYQRLIRQAQETYQISVAPLQLLVGGWSGAVVYLVSVSSNASGQVEHCILKLDRKKRSSKADEVTRHTNMLTKASSKFARQHIAELAFERLEVEGAIGIFYRIAGQSLLDYRPLSSYRQENQLKTIFAKTNAVLLAEWNADMPFEQAVNPQEILKKWLGFRLDPGGNIERFLQSDCGVRADIPGFLINGGVFPNPLAYARQSGSWGQARPLDIALGFLHGDLNTNNILVKFSQDDETLEGYYLIDFALFKEQMPLLYDQRYLEMSYLMLAMAQVSFARCINLLTQMAEVDILEPHKAPIEMSGVSAVISSGREAFSTWVANNHPSLHDDLWGQYWLAGVAAGLAYCHKVGLPAEQRLAGLIYAATNLKRYASIFSLPLPAEVELLFDEAQLQAGSSISPTRSKPHHNLPAQTTPFIGRSTQIAALQELMLNPDARLVTLIGPGGTGKTRLSLQVAQELLEHFPQGVIFVPLAEDRDANQFIARVAQQLGVREGGRPLLESLKDYLGDKRLLLVLDNFEQLVSVAPLVAEILGAAPQIKILTSSRVALNLYAERQFPVPPLDLPAAAGDSALEKLAANESIRLFVERASAIQPNFRLTAENAPLIAAICRRLDGLPLALELAAARIKVLPPQAILTRLDDQLKLLTGGGRDLPARQQTLRNTLEWSYNLLNRDEQTLYARLGVFAGGFSLEAAEAVCNPDGSLDILEGLTSLVNNSLLRQEETAAGEPRFGMLETVRAYALEKLIHSGESQTLRRQHALYFSDIVINRAGMQLYSAKALYWLNWLEQELDNIRATLAWCLSEPQGLELGPWVIFMLIWFYYRRGYVVEGGLWAERLLAAPGMQVSPLRGLVLSASGTLALWQGQQDIALARFQEGMQLELRREDGLMIAFQQMGQAVALINMGRDHAAQPLLQAAGTYFKEHDQPYLHVFTQVHLGNAELGLGNPQQAQALLQEAELEARTLGENWVLSFALNNLGEVARTQGHYEQARAYYEHCEALLQDTGDRGDLARFAHSLGYIDQHEGDYARAESQFRDSLVMFRQLGNRRGMAECMAGLAGLKSRQGQAQWGATMLSAAQSVLQATGGAWWPADRGEVERSQEFIRAALDKTALAQAQEKGQAMSLEQALAFASQGP